MGIEGCELYKTRIINYKKRLSLTVKNARLSFLNKLLIFRYLFKIVKLNYKKRLSQTIKNARYEL